MNEFLKNVFNTSFELIKYESKGEVSETYLIIANLKKYILKVNSKNNYEIFLKEKWCSEQANDIGIIVPKVKAVGYSTLESFILLEFREGIVCSDIENTKIKNYIFKKLGDYALKISNIKSIENIADLKRVEDAKKWFYEDYLNYEITQTQNKNDYLKLDPNNREKILKSLYMLKSISFDFCLNHGDLSLNNCLLQKDSGDLILLDFGSSETQPKYYFEIMLKWLELNYDKAITEENFMNFANGLLGENYKEWLKENFQIIKAFALLYALDKYRWAHDKSTKDWQDQYYSRLINVLKLNN